ncbi:PREDICTED: forkhead box protein L1-like isoform X1 [Amphimedon queenslandica]|uniref:Fork-head domain-containing protein n=2 Tax=Amphimedon queenslandica TaxID=400682 RepID=A0AAN0IWS0_AMPQE|nr:PREDICTED: forkhead box protein L1-like isoform X1 [Amphimedon queenslandica]|eukprot:XP_019849225.1 PREDICTED: forkhead box protein L1-like isoform X1 [Amphimedon queenslandica]
MHMMQATEAFALFHHNEGPIDNSLTSLNWLPDFQIPSIDKLVVQPRKDSISSSGGDSVFENEHEKMERPQEELLPLSPLKRCMNQTAEFEQNQWKYQDNPAKPPFSYTTIIYLAIRSSKNDKVTLGEIYQWIKDHFMYYRVAESTWQNSVRHNLSLNDFFIKIPRSEGDPGKGSFWKINPEYENVVTNEVEFQRIEGIQNSLRMFSGAKRGKSRRKLHSTSSNGSKPGSKETTPQKRRPKSTSAMQMGSNVPDTDHHLLSADLDWTTLLSSQKMLCSTCHEMLPHTCPASFGTPITGTETDPVYGCSPSIIPMSLSTDTSSIIPTTSSLNPLLNEIMTSQESPAQLLPPWAESRSESPNIGFEHPWAETLRDRSIQISPESGQSWMTSVGLPMSGYPHSSSGPVPAVATLM